MAEEDRTVDVIQITNDCNRPYFLTSDNKCQGTLVRAGVIYSREADTNTPINSSAAEIEIENMWAERFGLTLTPMQRFLIYIEQIGGWIKYNPGQVVADESHLVDQEVDVDEYYFNQYPEFKIITHSNRIDNEYYERWNLKNYKVQGGAELGLITATLYYHSTRLKSYNLVNLENRYVFANPKFLEPFNQDNPKARIDRKSIEHKIAEILQRACDTISEESNQKLMQKYEESLKFGFSQHNLQTLLYGEGLNCTI